MHPQAPRRPISDEQSSGDATKRRSFLPQLGLPRPTPRAAGTKEGEPQLVRQDASSTKVERTSTAVLSEQTGTRGLRQVGLRPRSLYQNMPPPQDRNTARTDGEPSSTSVNPTTSKPSSLTSLNRSQSLKRPGTSTQTTTSTRTHGRTQSTSTITGGPRGATTATNVAPRMDRPKSISEAPIQVNTTRNATFEAIPGGIRTSARLEAMKRSANIKTKPEVASGRSTGSDLANSEEKLRADTGREASKTDNKKLSRPAFSTLQQHFTPRKAGKAPTSTFLHPPSEPADHVLPLETIALQNELLQLHLLHKSSSLISREWETSVHDTLRVRFEELGHLYQTMRDIERVGQEEKNMLALREWHGGSSISGLAEHIQALSNPLQEIPSLLDPGGRFSQLVHEFEIWLSRVEEVWVSRNSPSEYGNMGHSLGGLGDAWKAENASLSRKLTALSRHLDVLSEPVEGSSIAQMVSGCKLLMKGLLDELQVMVAIETGVMVQEKQWVEDRLRSIAHDMGACPEQPSEAWLMF